MFEKFLKSSVNNTNPQILETDEVKNMRRELDELQLKLDDEIEEFKALDIFTKDFVGNSSSTSNSTYDVVDEDIDLRTLQALYTSEGWFYIVVSAIVKAVVSLPCKMEKKKITTEMVELPNGDTEEVRNEIWVGANGEAEFDLFNTPNDIQSSLEFFMLLFIDLLSTGNCYIWVDRGEGGIEVDRPTARLQEAMRRYNHGVNGIYRMNSALIEPLVEDGELGVSGYGLMSAEGYIKFDASEMVHIKMPNPSNPFIGLAPIVPVLKNVLIDRFTSEHMIRFYKQGARLGGVIKTSKKLTKDQVTRLTRSFESNFTGKKNHHKTLILPEGMEYETIEVNPADASLIDFSKFNKEPILSTYSVPPVRVGLLDGATYANALIQDKAFWENAVKPILKIMEVGINQSGKIIKRERRLRFCWDLSEVEALQENVKDKAEIGKGLADSGWSIDEIREKHWKLPKLAEGEGGNLVPLVERTRKNESLLNGYTLNSPQGEEKVQSADAQPDQDTMTDIVSTDVTFNSRVGELTALNIASGLTPALAAQEAVARALDEGLLPNVPSEESTRESNEDPDNDTSTNEPSTDEDPQEDEPNKITSLPNIDEESLTGMVKALTGEGVDGLIEDRVAELKGTFSRMEKMFLESAKSLTTDKSGKLNKVKHVVKTLRSKADKKDEGLPSDKDIEAFSKKEAQEHPSQTQPTAMEVGFDNTLKDTSLTFPNDEALKVIKEDAADKVVGITQTTKDQMRKVIAQAFEAQSTPQELANMISDKFTEIGLGRAMTIARTETLTAVSEGQELKKNKLLQDIPEMADGLKKAWINANDRKVRNSHLITGDEGPIDHDAKFSNGLMYPREKGGEASEVINCRCTVIYFMDTEQQQIEGTLADDLLPTV